LASVYITSTDLKNYIQEKKGFAEEQEARKKEEEEVEGNKIE